MWRHSAARREYLALQHWAALPFPHLSATSCFPRSGCRWRVHRWRARHRLTRSFGIWFAELSFESSQIFHGVAVQNPRHHLAHQQHLSFLHGAAGAYMAACILAAAVTVGLTQSTASGFPPSADHQRSAS